MKGNPAVTSAATWAGHFGVKKERKTESRTRPPYGSLNLLLRHLKGMPPCSSMWAPHLMCSAKWICELRALPQGVATLARLRVRIRAFALLELALTVSQIFLSYGIVLSKDLMDDPLQRQAR